MRKIHKSQKVIEGDIMSALSLHLSESICHHGRGIEKKERVSINQFISLAVSEEICALITQDYLEKRAKRAKKKDFRKILDKVPSRNPIPGDEL